MHKLIIIIGVRVTPSTGKTGRSLPLSLALLAILACLGTVHPVYAEGDIIGDIISAEAKKKPTSSAKKPSTKKARKKVIVIDPGHGGKDTGAIGVRKVREKDLVLQLSRRLAKELKKIIDAEIILTRSNDKFITLDQRDEIAIAKKADAFLSIHANSAKRKEANGIEIYYLNDGSDEAANRLAARENKGSKKSLSDLKKILSTLIQTDSTELSQLLAKEVKKSIHKQIASRYSLERLDIKTALFYVLVGSQAPSILLEVGFVTNPKEAKRLGQKEYQERLSKAVAAGVARYFKVIESQKVNL